MKECTNCGLLAFDDEPICEGCLHLFDKQEIEHMKKIRHESEKLVNDWIAKVCDPSREKPCFIPEVDAYELSKLIYDFVNRERKGYKEASND